MDKQEIFPDGTVIDKWFYDITIPELSDLGKQYVLTDYNILDDGKITEMGTHDELIAKKGYYYEVFKLQNDGFGKEAV